MKSVSRFTVLLLAGAILAGCARSTATPTPTAATGVFLVDGLGTNVELAAPAKRIVSLGASNTEILFALGAGPQVVGTDLTSDFPAEAKPLATIADYPTLNVESIVALKPDLVLAAETIAPEQVQALRDLGLTVYWLGNPVKLPGDLFANIETIGKLAGRLTEAKDLVSKLQIRVNTVRTKLTGITVRPVVYYELDATDPTRPYTAGPGTFVDSLISLAGGRNLGESLTSAWAPISSEEILRRDPQIIILGDSAYGVTIESLGNRPGWENLSAVKTGQVFPFDDNLVSRPGPRMIDGLEALARLLHPEAF